MRDKTLRFLVYFSTPIMLIVGLVVMYVLISNHPWFHYIAGGYTVMLAVLYIVKINVYNHLFRKNQSQRDGPPLDI